MKIVGETPKKGTEEVKLSGKWTAIGRATGETLSK